MLGSGAIAGAQARKPLAVHPRRAVRSYSFGTIPASMTTPAYA
jgi:hypothetical protein